MAIATAFVLPYSVTMNRLSVHLLRLNLGVAHSLRVVWNVLRGIYGSKRRPVPAGICHDCPLMAQPY